MEPKFVKTLKEICQIPKVIPVDESPQVIVYKDSDGYFYNYNIFILTNL